MQNSFWMLTQGQILNNKLDFAKIKDDIFHE